MVRRASPYAMTTFESQHVQRSIYFVKDYVLDRWDDRVELGVDSGLNGAAGDDKLLELARKAVATWRAILRHLLFGETSTGLRLPVRGA